MRCRSRFFLPSFCSLGKHKVGSRVCVPCSNLSKEERTKIAFLRPSLEPQIAGFLRERLQVFFLAFCVRQQQSVFLPSSDFCQEKKLFFLGNRGSSLFFFSGRVSKWKVCLLRLFFFSRLSSDIRITSLKGPFCLRSHRRKRGPPPDPCCCRSKAFFVQDLPRKLLSFKEGSGIFPTQSSVFS